MNSPIKKTNKQTNKFVNQADPIHSLCKLDWFDFVDDLFSYGLDFQDIDWIDLIRIGRKSIQSDLCTPLFVLASKLTRGSTLK